MAMTTSASRIVAWCVSPKSATEPLLVPVEWPAWLHAIIKDAAPVRSPRTWYGMPAYAKDGKVVCYFKGADKLQTRYTTF